MVRRRRSRRDPSDAFVYAPRQRWYTIFSRDVRVDVDLEGARYITVVRPARDEVEFVTFFLFHVRVFNEATREILFDQKVETAIAEHPQEPTDEVVERAVLEVLDDLIRVNWRLFTHFDYDAKSRAVGITWDPSRPRAPHASRNISGADVAEPLSTSDRRGSTREERRRIAFLINLSSSPNTYEAETARAKAQQLLRKHGLTVEEIGREFGIYRRSSEFESRRRRQ